jgi:hypothetical protein
VNPAVSAVPVACRGVSERMGNIIIPYGSKILRSLLRKASNAKKLKIFKDVTEIISIVSGYL